MCNISEEAKVRMRLMREMGACDIVVAVEMDRDELIQKQSYLKEEETRRDAKMPSFRNDW